MQDQPIRTPTDEARHKDRAILNLLVDPVELWSIEELTREIGDDHNSVIDSLDRLCGAGLVHRCDKFAFATKAAKGYYELMEESES